jgi:DUF971 family protein
MNPLRPAEITANRQTGEFEIKWNDGHYSCYSFTFLRRACPCASCRGGHENMGTLPAAEVYHLPVEDSPETRVSRVEAVGSYALTIEWEDGHHYGIYNWSYLRAICPCQDCRPAQ